MANRSTTTATKREAGGSARRERERRRRQQERARSLRRWAAILGGVLVVVLAAVLGTLYVRGRQPSAQLVGPLMAHSPAAPDFALVDEHGQRVQMSAYRGKVVALTFLYTHCPDVCPLIAGKIAAAQRQLGADDSGVVFLAVTVDPTNDTPEAVDKFDATHGLNDANWHYLLGSMEELKPVWSSYYVGSDASEVPGAPASQVSTPQPDLVNHTSIVYLIDPSQHVRVALDANFAVPDLVHDVRALATQ